MKIDAFLKLCVLLPLLVACGRNATGEQKEVIVPVNLTSPQKELPLSSFVDSVTTFRLTLPDSLFWGSVSRILFDEENIFVSDSKQEAVFRFDRSGQFLNAIGRKGRGPGEYTRLSSCFPGSHCLFIEDLGARRILCYAYDGTFIRDISFSFSVVYDDIIALPDSNFLCYELFCSRGDKERGLWIMNNQGERVDTVLVEKGIYPYSSSVFSRLSVDAAGMIHAFNPSSGEFYTYNPLEKKLRKAYRLHPDVKMLSEFRGENNALNLKEEHACCSMAVESDRYLLTLWAVYSDRLQGRGVHALYDKLSGEMKTCEQLQADLPGVFALGSYVSSNYPNALTLYYSDEHTLIYHPEEYKKLGMKENVLIVKVLHFASD